MKVTGFTFIRNAIRYEYPIDAAVRSVLPLCDEFVVAVGQSEDGTRELISNLGPKIRIIDTVWDESLRTGGQVLAEETNKALRAVSADTDWCFYIQGDEVVHEQYHPAISEGMQRWKDDKHVDGLLFKYLHFYGSYDYVGTSSRWYPNEIRIVRNDKNIHSYRDAQGFRKGNDEKLNVKPLDAYIYHYGWVKEPAAMQRKQATFHKLWHDDAWVDRYVGNADAYDYTKDIDALAPFKGTHPKVMEELIARKNWAFDYDISFNHTPLKERLKQLAKGTLGLDFSYKNYKLI